MTIASKLFGRLGQSGTDARGAVEVARPGYSLWYARQMARSYESRLRPVAPALSWAA